jgi:hypothetical protein
MSNKKMISYFSLMGAEEGTKAAGSALLIFIG